MECIAHMKFLYRKFAVVVVAEKLLRFLFSDEKDQEVGDKVNGELHLELSGFYDQYCIT